MALAVALMFNIRLPINFNSPYKALSIQDFWRRWHITLSRFLRDYIYIPLGGNRNGEFHTYANLFAVFLIGGLWHGASWMFVIWGAAHGSAIVLHRAWQQMGQKINTFLAWFITFNFINITWIFFRAKEWSQASNIISGMIGANGLMLPEKLGNKFAFLCNYNIHWGAWLSITGMKTNDLLWIVGALIICLLFKNSNTILLDFKSQIKSLLFTYFLFCTSLIFLSDKSEFLYFNF